ncbi:MAG: nucleotide pyrophosphohydrolase [Desulfobulbaceae bacterium A2]|nr:MAG: nucleotide pyrophosphohydrolase [Desulfobulbaceae bacterium A2]
MDTLLARLHATITRLRGPGGCPWDCRQTPQSMKKYLLEETKELAEAIEEGDADHVREELGDLFFILTMLAVLYEERGDFTLGDSLQDIQAKMVRRHPHVFGDAPTPTIEEQRRLWEAIKADEKDPSPAP